MEDLKVKQEMVRQTKDQQQQKVPPLKLEEQKKEVVFPEPISQGHSAGARRLWRVAHREHCPVEAGNWRRPATCGNAKGDKGGGCSDFPFSPSTLLGEVGKTILDG